MHKNDGFTLVETLLGLLALSICSLLLIPLLQVILHLPKQFQYNEDIQGIVRLRYMFAQSTPLESTSSSIKFRYHAKEWELLFHHENIVKEPGYEIFLMNIDDAKFYQKDTCLYMQYQKGGNTYDALLVCE